MKTISFLSLGDGRAISRSLDYSKKPVEDIEQFYPNPCAARQVAESLTWYDYVLFDGVRIKTPDEGAE